MTRQQTLPVAVLVAVTATGCAATIDSATPTGGATPTESAASTDGVTPSVSATARAKQSASSSAPTSLRVEVETNHCFVEPVRFDGGQWNVRFDEQFGWGGMLPRRWKGTGVMTRVSEDRARFEDDGGSTVAFRPVDDPSVRPVEKAGCD